MPAILKTCSRVVSFNFVTQKPNFKSNPSTLCIKIGKYPYFLEANKNSSKKEIPYRVKLYGCSTFWAKVGNPPHSNWKLTLLWMGSNFTYFCWGVMDSTTPYWLLLKGCFRVKWGLYPKRVLNHNNLGSKKNFQKGVPNKFLSKIFFLFGQYKMMLRLILKLFYYRNFFIRLCFNSANPLWMSQGLYSNLNFQVLPPASIRHPYYFLLGHL